MTNQTNLNQASSTGSIVILGNLNRIGLQDFLPGALPTITGTSNSEVLRGTDGNDIISGLEGRDTLFGGPGNDVLIGGLDSDRLIGGFGSDRFVFNNFNERTDTIVDFNVRQDALVLSNLFSLQGDKGIDPIADGYVQFVQDGSSTRVQVDPDGVGDFPFTTIAILDNVRSQSLTATVINESLDTASSDEVIGTSSSDSESVAERSSALLQADRLIATEKNDFLVGLEESDTLTGGASDNILVGGLGSDILTGGLGSDSEALVQADRLVFPHFNEQTGKISDFSVNEDQLLLVNLLAQLNYNSVQPITDGYVQFIQQGMDISLPVQSDGVDSLFQTMVSSKMSIQGIWSLQTM